MREVLEIIGSFATVWLLTWFLCLALVAVSYPLVRRRLLRWYPGTAANLLLVILAFPLLLSFTSSLLLFLPLTDTALVSTHCHDNCQAHVPVIDIPWLVETGIALILIVIAAMTGYLARNLLAARKLRGRLALLSKPELSEPESPEQELPAQGDGYCLLDDHRPFVFTLGWWHNKIYLTRGLKQNCSRRELAIMLAHEQAHAKRRDNVHLLLAKMFLLPLPRSAKDLLFGDLHYLVESACDFIAAGYYGATDVAETLLHFQKLVPRQLCLDQAGISSAFTGSEVEWRIHALLDYRSETPWQRWGLQLSVVMLALASLSLVDPLHHGIEMLVGLR